MLILFLNHHNLVNQFLYNIQIIDKMNDLEIFQSLNSFLFQKETEKKVLVCFHFVNTIMKSKKRKKSDFFLG